jgi:hypothetical protein
MTTTNHLEALRAHARYRRGRLDLYRARVYGPHPTSPARLEELTREYETRRLEPEAGCGFGRAFAIEARLTSEVATVSRPGVCARGPARRTRRWVPGTS